MVFPKAIPFVRFTTFSKSLGHAYTQSIAAATQPWNQNGTLQSRLQQFHSLNQAKNGYGNKIGAPGAVVPKKGDLSQETILADYFREWSKNQLLGANHWRQYQFVKAIEWTPQSAEEESGELVASEKEIIDAKNVTETITPLENVVAVQEGERSTTPAVLITSDPPADIETEIVDTTEAYTTRLQELAASQNYAEIPVTFKAMSDAGVAPTSTCYNILLQSVSALWGPAKASSMACDIYSDMLERQVRPTMETFDLILHPVAAQALAVAEMREQNGDKSLRYGVLVSKDEVEWQNRLERDDSLDVATRLLDTAFSLYPSIALGERLYPTLIKAFAASDRVADIAKIYAHMENNGIIPSAKVFANLIPALARCGDIDNAMDSYNEYKSLATRSQESEVDFKLDRADADVYAAVIRAFIIDNQVEKAQSFLDKLVQHFSWEPQNVRDMMGLKAFLPELLKRGAIVDAYKYATDMMNGAAQETGLYYVCIAAADASEEQIAIQAHNALINESNIIKSAMAMSALYARRGDLFNADRFWEILSSYPPVPELVDLATLHASGALDAGLDKTAGVHRARSTFRRLRAEYPQKEMLHKVRSAIQVIGHNIIRRNAVLEPATALQLLHAMDENDLVDLELQSHVLAAFGPEEIRNMDWNSLEVMAQSQTNMILSDGPFDVGNAARLATIIEVMGFNHPSNKTALMIESALGKLNNPNLSARWGVFQYPASPQMTVPSFSYGSSPMTASFSSFSGPAMPESPAISDNFDPYAATTDTRGSSIIADILERPGNGKIALEEALARFRGMKSSGRHPRFFTYAKLITAACKAERLPLAEEILAQARQDIPYQPQYRVVRHGWANMLDAMVAGCLVCGRRDQADVYRQELAGMGASPTANTFGLYITTLKESTKSSDEATEAINIFAQAKAENVTPTPFLYNALIGKLGKARRIDDVLFYFSEMRALNIRPTCVTYGTVVNALTRVSNETEAVKIFDEMESQPAYKARPAPYHSMMQFYLMTKRDRSKVLEYYERMRARNITPTAHTFKLLVDAHATLEPVDMQAAERVLVKDMPGANMRPEAVHHAALIHAKGCGVETRDLEGAERIFHQALKEVDAGKLRPEACLFQSMLEALGAADSDGTADSEGSTTFVDKAPKVIEEMRRRRVGMTAYVANALISGWSHAGRLQEAEKAYNSLKRDQREPSTYEALTRALVNAGERDRAQIVVQEAMMKKYPSAVYGRILDLLPAVSGGAAL